MYFADTPEAARKKSQHGNDVVVMVTAEFGRAAVFEDSLGLPFLSGSDFRNAGCDSMKIRTRPSANWEFVLFDPSRVTLVRTIG
jgi:hypothetical protein